MAEPIFQILQNGQSVLEADFDLLGLVSGLADDRVFAELLRLTPFDGSTVSRGIMPFGHASSARTALVAPNGASGSVLVEPFRAVIGSRTAVATDAKKNWRDIRSAIAVGTTTLAQTISFAANGSGNPRWDLVYAAITVDGNGPSVVRKVKDPVTKAISGPSIVTTLVTSVVVGVQAGTPAASPTWPTTPSDAGSTYYIPLAYVRVPNGFGPTTTVLATDIAICASTLLLARATGAATLRVADGQTALASSAQQSWGSSGTRPKTWMPSSMVGAEALLLTIDTSSSNGTILDSRDWRGRWVSWKLSTAGHAAAGDPPDPGLVGTPYAYNALEADPNLTFATGMAQTLRDADSDGKAKILRLDGAHFQSTLGSGNTIDVYVDLADGKLKFEKTGTPSIVVHAWIDFSAPLEDA